MRKRKLIITSLVALLVTGSIYYTANAANVIINVSVPETRSMTVPGTISITGVVGSTVNQDLSITAIKANTSWTLSVKKDASYNLGNGDLYSATANSGAGYTIPSSKFKFVSTAQGTATEFSGIDKTVRSGSITGETGVNETVSYKLSVDYNDAVASDYAARHIYTIGP